VCSLVPEQPDTFSARLFDDDDDNDEEDDGGGFSECSASFLSNPRLARRNSVRVPRERGRASVRRLRCARCGGARREADGVTLL